MLSFLAALAAGAYGVREITRKTYTWEAEIAKEIADLATTVQEAMPNVWSWPKAQVTQGEGAETKADIAEVKTKFEGGVAAENASLQGKAGAHLEVAERDAAIAGERASVPPPSTPLPPAVLGPHTLVQPSGGPRHNPA